MLPGHLGVVRMSQSSSRSSRRRHRKFVEDYKAKRLDALLDQELEVELVEPRRLQVAAARRAGRRHAQVAVGEARRCSGQLAG